MLAPSLCASQFPFAVPSLRINGYLSLSYLLPLPPRPLTHSVDGRSNPSFSSPRATHACFDLRSAVALHPVLRLSFALDDLFQSSLLVGLLLSTKANHLFSELTCNGTIPSPGSFAVTQSYSLICSHPLSFPSGSAGSPTLPARPCFVDSCAAVVIVQTS